jgi:hypothetical protein
MEDGTGEITGGPGVNLMGGMVWNSARKRRQGYSFTFDGLNRLTPRDYPAGANQ